MPTVDVGGVGIAYDVHGRGRPHLVICGTGQPALSWSINGYVPYMVEVGYQVVTFDNRGMPPSDTPAPPYTVEEMAADAIGLLEHLGNGPYSLLGASLGGWIAQTVALQRPDLVEAVVFVKGCGHSSAYAQAIVRARLDLEHLPVVPRSIRTALSLASAILPAQWDDAKWVEAAVEFEDSIGDPSSGLMGQLHAVAAWNSRPRLDELAELRMPALAIAGEYDAVFPPACVRAAVAKMPAGEYVQIDGSTHTSADPEHALQTVVAIDEFLRRHVPATR